VIAAPFYIPTEPPRSPVFSHDKHMIRSCVCWLGGSKASRLVYFCKRVFNPLRRPRPSGSYASEFCTVLLTGRRQTCCLIGCLGNNSVDVCSVDSKVCGIPVNLLTLSEQAFALLLMDLLLFCQMYLVFAQLVMVRD
jgi:hypothetical protein